MTPAARFLIDTDHLTIIQAPTQPEFDRLWPRLGAHPPAAFHMPIISFHEQVLGWNAYIGRARDAAGVVRGYRMF
jgi:tRNA(fMet)-specific endonuclease VapC